MSFKWHQGVTGRVDYTTETNEVTGRTDFFSRVGALLGEIHKDGKTYDNVGRLLAWDPRPDLILRKGFDFVGDSDERAKKEEEQYEKEREEWDRKDKEDRERQRQEREDFVEKERDKSFERQLLENQRELDQARADLAAAQTYRPQKKSFWGETKPAKPKEKGFWAELWEGAKRDVENQRRVDEEYRNGTWSDLQ